MIRTSLRRYIEGTLLRGQPVSDDQNLLLSGLLDSLSVMALVTFIEDTFDLKIPFGDVLIENFESIDAMHGYLVSRGADG